MIREMTKDDYQIFMEMGNLFYQSSALEIPLATETIERTFQHIVSNSPYIKGFILEKDNKVAGFATISFAFSTEFGGNIILFEDLFIKDAFQGQGLGTIMFNYLEETYKDQVVAIKLEVSRVNKRAKKLYEILDYEVNDYISMVKKVG